MPPQVGANECWHKKSSFKEHLYQTYKIAKIWGLDDIITGCMLFHSAYSNSYVNLAIFKAGADRARLQELVGEECEALIHLFCVVPRSVHLWYRSCKSSRAWQNEHASVL